MSETGRAPNLFDVALASLRRLPDIRAAIEALILFLLVLAAGIWAVQSGALVLDPASRSRIATLWLGVFLWPVLVEELAFRSWLRPGATLAAVLSFVAFVAWHPVQLMLGLPTARPEYGQPAFLVFVACLGFACTLIRLRSGSIWPGVVIHWGIWVLWLALFGGGAPAGLQSP